VLALLLAAGPPLVRAQSADSGVRPTQRFVVEAGQPMRIEPIRAPPIECTLSMGLLDRVRTGSTACLGCHDASRGGHAAFRHPVDVLYVPYGRELSPDPEKQEPGVVLGEGRVTCLTCHDPVSTLPRNLSAPVVGEVPARLCAACHAR
jgi:hypothetical protein